MAGHASRTSLPSYSARIARFIKHAKVDVEYSYHVSIGWTKPCRISLASFDALARGHEIRVVLCSSFDLEGARRWRWGDDVTRTFNEHYFFPTAKHVRGRIIFMDENGREDSSYFIASPNLVDDGWSPEVIGEHMWGFVWDWELNEHV